MAEPATAIMSEAEFFAWQEHQDVLYEVVGGRPTSRMVTGATQRHDVVVVNALAALRQKLRGGRCRPHTDDVALRTVGSNLRRPDVTVNGGRADPLSTTADKPVLVLEVLSPSTEMMDRIMELEEYKRVPSLRYILIADPAVPPVVLYGRRREAETWTSLTHIGVNSILDLPEIGCTLGLSELYEDVPGAAGSNAPPG